MLSSVIDSAQWWDSNFSSAGSITLLQTDRSYILSVSSVSTNGTSISSNANRFAVLIKFPETVL